MNTSATGKFVIAVDLGGTSLRVATVTPDGRILQRASVPTAAWAGVDAVIDRMVLNIRDLVGPERLSQAMALAVAAPGPTDPWAGVIENPPNLPGWKYVPLKQILEDRLGLPTYVGNDANAAALGEHRYGAGKGTVHMIYVTVSTGIGGGIIVDGKLLLGKNGGAGEVGHMIVDLNGPRCACGNIGCLEALASGTAIARQAVASMQAGATSSISGDIGADLNRITGMLVVQHAKTGDALAKEIVLNAATALGVGVANLVNLFDPQVIVIGGGVSNAGPMLFDPQVIVIGGGVSNAGPMLFDPVRREVDERAIGINRKGLQIVPTALGDDVGLLGAAALALGGVRSRLESWPV